MKYYANTEIRRLFASHTILQIFRSYQAKKGTRSVPYDRLLSFIHKNTQPVCSGAKYGNGMPSNFLNCATLHPGYAAPFPFPLSPFPFPLSPFTFPLSPFTFHLSPFTFHLSPFTFHLSSFPFLIFLTRSTAIRPALANCLRNIPHFSLSLAAIRHRKY